MSNKHGNFTKLLLTAAITSSSALLTGCGGGGGGGLQLKDPATEQKEANRAELVAAVATSDFNQAVQAAEAAAKRKIELQAAAAKEKAEATVARAIVVAKPVQAFVEFATSKGYNLDGSEFSEDVVLQFLGSRSSPLYPPTSPVDDRIKLFMPILTTAGITKGDGSPLSQDEKKVFLKEFYDSARSPTSAPAATVDPEVEVGADPYSDVLLNKPATGDDSYGLTEGEGGTLEQAVAKVRDVAAFRSVFGIMGIPEPEQPPIRDPLAALLAGTLTPPLKKALITAKTDEDYAPIIDAAKENPVFESAVSADQRLKFFKIVRAKAIAAALAPADAGLSLSTGIIRDLSGNYSLRTARTALTGQLDTHAFAMNGHQGTQLDLGLPLFVQLKGSVDGGKSTDTTTGSVAYRLGNTVIGAIQAYANSGNGFGLDGRQLETSVVASHSFGGFFVESQLGAVSANNVHTADWSGVRSQVTLGVDTQFVSPFIQVAHRQLDRNHTYALNDTAAYVGLDVEIAGLTTDAYRIDTRLLTKVGVGSKDWTHGSKAVGSTTGFEGSVEWSGSLTLNSGVSFSTNLGLDTVAGSAAKFNISVER
jgi:hypothetical protein